MTDERRMSTVDDLRAAGASPKAIELHYDLSDEFFGLWLGSDMVYSCALWDPTDATDNLARAQQRKLDHFATRLDVAGRRVLDIGCGWGAMLDRMVRMHGAAGGVGLTLSPNQQASASARGVPGVEYAVRSWVDHDPVEVYDAITCVEMTEHLASDALDPDGKVAVYRAFFDRCASWLRDDGRMGLQLICQDNVGHDGSRPGVGRISELIRTAIFPESMPGSIAELALGWETHFRLDEFLDHTDHYRRTFRAWGLAARAEAERGKRLVGDEDMRTFQAYFAAGEALFRVHEHALYRVVLSKRPRPKQWAAPLLPSGLPGEEHDRRPDPADSASAAAIRSHYDVANDFYRLWLGRTMMYSSGMWPPASDDPLDVAVERKIDYFAEHAVPPGACRVLDVGCGWGGNLRRLAEQHGVTSGVGLTLSEAQLHYLATNPVPGAEIRLEPWAEHRPTAPYDAILIYGALEHFARDGSTRTERVAVYRRFFASCWYWLVPDGRLGLETIAHDDAPDTANPLGRGPLGDVVLQVYPESLSPDLGELLLGLEPYFAVEILRSDAADFARTCRQWLLALRSAEAEATALVGPDTYRAWYRYLLSSEVQFRMNTITNYRLVLRRRPHRRH
jgi:cyclopropane-fatty-acyl-phospholipid synthase